MHIALIIALACTVFSAIMDIIAYNKGNDNDYTATAIFVSLTTSCFILGILVYYLMNIYHYLPGR